MILLLFLSLSTLNELYEGGKYFVVIEKAEEALKDTGLTPQDEVGIHTILAFCYVALEKDRLAKLEFLEALAIDPKLELDPVMTSPKIIKTFQEAKATFHFFPKGVGVGLKPAPTKIKKDFVAFAIPGSWDIGRGDKKRGYFLLGWSSTSLLSLSVSHYLCEKYHREYLDARDRDIINDKYKAYSFWYQARTYSLISFISTYAINLFILAISP